MNESDFPVRKWDEVGDRQIYFNASSGPETSFLSNFHPSPFTIDDIMFSCIEQYFQWSKMKRYGRDDVAARILAETRPSSMKALARRGKGAFLSKDEVRDWSDASVDVMRVAVTSKFDSSNELREMLAATGDATLVERWSVRGKSDTLWGVSAASIGRNRLGELLMEYRACLVN